MKIHARRLLQFSTKDLWEILTGCFDLEFDDGTIIKTTHKEAIYSSFFWEFHRLYPMTPLLHTHHVSAVLKGDALSSNTHIELLNIVYWATVNAYVESTLLIRDDLIKLIYQVTNTIYNDLSIKTEEYITTIDILDFIAINNHIKVKEAFTNLNTDEGSTIEKAYTVIMDVISTDKAISDNSLVKAIKSKLVKTNQVMQCVGPRGFVSEVDGAILPVPVLRSFTQGMRTLYNTIAESRTAAKSLYYSESPLQESEYFARRLQLTSMYVERLAYVDCGSTDYLLWEVKPSIVKDGREVYPGDLKFILGKYYLDESTNTLKYVTKNDTHLSGTSIKLRSVLFCKHPDPHTVCKVCFGRMTENITPTANLGHVSASTMTHQTTQSVLGTKHLDVSSSSDQIAYTDILKAYFLPVNKNNSFFLIPRLKDSDLRLIVSREEAAGLTDILLIKDIRDINPNRICNLSTIGFATNTVNQDSPTLVNVSQQGKKALFTSEFIAYILENKWTLNASNSFVFNLADWDYKKPIFRLPDVEYSYSKHSKQIASVIESSMERISDRDKPESPVFTLKELFDLVNSKINVNLALLEVIIYGMMVANMREGNYLMGRNSPNVTLGVSADVIGNRSLSAAYAYEVQAATIVNPKSFFSDGRPDSIFDVMITPGEVINS